jgi:hypothetical protein
MFKGIFIFSFFYGGILLANSTLPELDLVRSSVQTVANGKLIDVRMLLYIYYQDGFCQTCSTQENQLKAEQFKMAMGSDFEKLSEPSIYQIHKKEVKNVYFNSPSVGQDEIATVRSTDRIIKDKIFMTCIDYSKVFLKFMRLSGIAKRNLRYVVLMNKASYLKMCPARDNSFPIWPRPFVHTSIAYKKRGTWYLVNPESRQEEVIHLGKKLPERLQKEIEFPSVASKPLIWAGAFEINDFENSYPWRSLLNIMVSGTPELGICR